MKKFSNKISIDNLNQLPYTPPKYFEDICNSKINNKNKKDCSIIDPYYDDRRKFYSNVYTKYITEINKNKTLDFYQKKKIMKNILHKGYKDFQKNGGILAYGFFDNFKKEIFIKIDEDIDIQSKSGNCSNLTNYISEFKIEKFKTDPFYSFITLIDWITKEIIADKSLDDNYILCYIQFLIDKGYIGFNQYRFFLHITILKRKRKDFILKLLDKYRYFKPSLEEEYTFEGGLYKCIIKDLSKFALINNSYKILKLFIDECKLDIEEDIPEKLKNTFQNEIGKLIKIKYNSKILNNNNNALNNIRGLWGSN